MKRSLVLIFFACLVFTFCASYSLAGQDKDAAGPIVNLQAEAQSEISNDLMIVRLQAMERGKDAAKLADIVNSKMRKAVALARKVKDLRVKTLGYRTSQWWEKGRQKGWQVSQDLELKGKDMKSLTDLLGRLQAFLHVTSMGFEPSKERVEAVQNRLIAIALQKFKKRADIVAKELGFSRWTPKNLSISTSGRYPKPVPVYRAKMMSEAADMVTAPEVAPGMHVVKVNADGSVILVK